MEVCGLNMTMNRNEIIKVEIEDFTKDGEGIGHADGYTLFVKDAVIGDVVLARITGPKKGYAYARVEEIISPSQDRIEGRCPEARRCGGCRLQEYRYEKQLEFKRRLVENALRRIGGFEIVDAAGDVPGDRTADKPVKYTGRVGIQSVIGMETPWRYRNKAQYPVASVRTEEGSVRTEAGFYAGRTHSLIPVRDCVLTGQANQRILSEILIFMERNHIPAYDEKSGEGLVRHVLIREGFVTGEIMVCPVINGDRLPKASKLVEALARIPGVKSICINVTELRGQWFYDIQQHRGMQFEENGALSSINSERYSYKEWKLLNGKLYLYYVDMQQVSADRHEFLVEEAEILHLTAEELQLSFLDSIYTCRRQHGLIMLGDSLQ